jgi:exonuclease VII small subunit
MESVPCEFVFQDINAKDRANLCSIVRSTNTSIARLEAKISQLQTAVAAKRQGMQQQLQAVEEKVAQEASTGQPSQATLEELSAARQRLSGYDDQVAKLTAQLEAYKKLPPVMQRMNQQIDTVTSALNQQLPGGGRPAVPPSSPAAAQSIPVKDLENPFTKMLTDEVAEDNEVAESIVDKNKEAYNPFVDPQSPLSKITDSRPMTFGDEPTPSVALSPARKGVTFGSPLSTVYKISPPEKKPTRSTRLYRAELERTPKERRPDITAYTRLSPTEDNFIGGT